MPGKEARNTLIWGIILFLAGAAGLYVFGYQPWRDGLNHLPKVTLSFKALLVSPVFAFLGGAMLWAALAPPTSAETAPVEPVAPGTPAPVPRRAWILLAALGLGAVGAVAYYFWLRAFLRAQGYDV